MVENNVARVPEAWDRNQDVCLLGNTCSFMQMKSLELKNIHNLKNP